MKLRSFVFLVASLSSVLAAAGSAPTGDDATLFCPQSVTFQFVSPAGRTYMGIAQRGRESIFGKVFYSFSAPSTTYGWSAAGTFFVQGYECVPLRAAGFIFVDGNRLEYAEYSTLACGDDTEENPVADYSPYDGPTGPGDGCAGTGASGGGNNPLAEDEWYETIEGVRFRCRRMDDGTGTNIVYCVAED